jgi:polar amino acid transport system substrate-binding protein
MKKFSVLVILLLILIASPCLAGEIERIQQKGEIAVSLNRAYPPFSMEKNGNVFGLDVDLANLLADSLHVKVKFIRPEHYDQQIPNLLAGESDIIIAAMTRTVERGLKVNFSAPYFEVSQAALARRDLLPTGADSYFDLLEIKGLRLGVKAGTTHEKFAAQLFASGTIKRFPTAAAAAEALVKGQVNAMVADSPFVRVWRNTHPQYYSRIAALLTPVTREYYAFAIRPGDPMFLTWLNLFIDQVKTDGTLDLLTDEYFEQMSWAGLKTVPEKKLNRAQFLKNRFMMRKQAEIEKRRRKFQGNGDQYE